MTQYRIRPLADADLDRYTHYIAQDNLSAALRLYDQARFTYKKLAMMPHMGTRYRSEKAELADMRFFPIKDFPHYLVFYQPSEAGIDIVRILHSRMDKESHL